MSHLEENSSFDDEYQNMAHGPQPHQTLQVFPCEGQTVHQIRLSENLSQRPTSCRHGPSQWECSILQSRRKTNPKQNSNQLHS